MDLDNALMATARFVNSSFARNTEAKLPVLINFSIRYFPKTSPFICTRVPPLSIYWIFAATSSLILQRSP